MSTKKITSAPLKTIFVITGGFLAVYLLTKGQWAIYASIFTLLTGVSSPYLAKKIETGWFKLAEVLGYIVPNILLTLIFYGVLTPLAVLSRMFGEQDQLSLKNKKASLFKDYTKKIDRAFFEKTW